MFLHVCPWHHRKFTTFSKAHPAAMLFLALLPFITHLPVAFSSNIQLPTASTCKRPQTQLAARNAEFACTNSIDWVGDGYNNDDCRATIQRLYNVEITKHGRQEFEFLSPGATNKTALPAMRTPRRYIVGKSLPPTAVSQVVINGTNRSVYPCHCDVGLLSRGYTAWGRSSRSRFVCQYGRGFFRRPLDCRRPDRDLLSHDAADPGMDARW